MKKNSVAAIIIILTLSLFFTHRQTYDLLCPLFLNLNLHYPLMFLSASFYLLFSISVTEDIKEFEQFWNKHHTLQKIFDRFLHICTCMFFLIVLILISLPSLFSFSHDNDEIKTYKKDFKDRVIAYDNKPLIVRCFICSAVIAIIWISANQFWGISEDVNELITDIFDYINDFISLLFIYAAIKRASVNN